MPLISHPPPSTFRGPSALVLSGGGARGAYEAGVLSYLFGEFAKQHGVPKIDIISGTSVGAINGSYLASVLAAPTDGIQRLESLWSELELPSVLGFGIGQAAKLPRLLRGGRDGTGLLDVAPLRDIVSGSVRWNEIARNLRKGTLRALTISATHVATGRPYIFVDSVECSALTGMTGGVVVREERIGPAHVLASAAIPLLFAPERVGTELFVDGGLRLNTPIAPALHLGARRVLVIGLTTPPNAPPVPTSDPGVYPGASFLLGKVLNAFLLDHVNADLMELERVNRFLDDGTAAFGPTFIDRINDEARRHGRTPRERIYTVSIHPSEDIGRLAAQYLRKNSVRFGRLLGRSLSSLLDIGEGADSDLISYLMFDGGFAAQLMEIARSDARKEAVRLRRFFAADGDGNVERE